MRTSGVVSDLPFTVAIFLIALAFLVVLAGGPSQFALAVEHTLEAALQAVTQLVQGLRA